MSSNDRSPHEALVVYEFVNGLCNAIRDLYERQLLKKPMQAERSTDPADWSEESSEDPDDKIRF